MNPREVICIALLGFQFVFLLRLVMSFFPLASGSAAASVKDLTVTLTDPVVLPLRRRIPPLPGMLAGFGLAELLVLILIQVLAQVVCR
jgi:uncharacterized protein YggT (Ycf19 family)